MYYVILYNIFFDLYFVGTEEQTISKSLCIIFYVIYTILNRVILQRIEVTLNRPIHLLA